MSWRITFASLPRARKPSTCGETSGPRPLTFFRSFFSRAVRPPSRSDFFWRGRCAPAREAETIARGPAPATGNRAVGTLSVYRAPTRPPNPMAGPRGRILAPPRPAGGHLRLPPLPPQKKFVLLFLFADPAAD